MAKAGAHRNERLAELMQDPAYRAQINESWKHTMERLTANPPRRPHWDFPRRTPSEAFLRRVGVWWCGTRYGHPGYSTDGGHCHRCSFPLFGEVER